MDSNSDQSVIGHCSFVRRAVSITPPHQGRKSAFGGGMKHWTASVVAILMASFPGVVSAQVDCNAVPAGPARTDCYIGLGRVYRGQSDVAAGNARVQSDAARLQQVTGTRGRSKASKHRRNRAATVGPK